MDTTGSTINHLEDFLQNTGPKQDCLVRIFEYINVYDMLNVSESSNHSELFIEFFKDRVIDMNTFDFVTNSSTREGQTVHDVFQHFGPDMQRIKVSIHCHFVLQFK